MIDLLFKILALTAVIFCWGFLWTWAEDREEEAHNIGAEPWGFLWTCIADRLVSQIEKKPPTT